MSRLALVLGLAMALLSCKKGGQDEPRPAASAAAASASAAASTDDKPPADDGPSCDVLVTEVRQACLDHYLEGLDVGCHSFITSANTAVKQSGAPGPNPVAAGRAGRFLCASTGKRLRAAVATAATTPPAPACKALGQALDDPCFRKIGTPEYDARCSGHLIVAKRTDSEQVCQGQLTAARASGLAK